MYNSQTPIDIHCSKLVDWLVQHRHCKKDWGENLASIRRKIKTALCDMPESEEIKQLLIESKLDYFKSKRIVELLKTTEADSKNIFGFYSSQRMKDWQDIVCSYERDCIHLAETATDLIRETNYEIPGIKKAIQKLKSEKDEAEKERNNLIRRIQQLNSEYQKLSQAYGINGVNVVQELRDQSKNLVDVMSQMVELSKHLKGGLEFYREHTSATTKLDSSKFLPMLDYVISKGNTTVYEWKNGEPPESIVAEDKSTTSSTGTSNPSDIDLGTDEIDFGDDLPSSSESSSGFVHVSTSEDKFIKLDEGCDSSGKVAKGDDARLVLEFRKSRNQFLNNLYELDAFFKQFSSEEQADTSTRISSSEVNKISASIRQINEIANKEKNRVLFQMGDSSTFIDNINDKFVLKNKQAADCKLKVDLINEKIQDIEARIKDTEGHLKRSIASARSLQEKAESSLSTLYKGRTINVMGCVN